VKARARKREVEERERESAISGAQCCSSFVVVAASLYVEDGVMMMPPVHQNTFKPLLRVFKGFLRKVLCKTLESSLAFGSTRIDLWLCSSSQHVQNSIRFRLSSGGRWLLACGSGEWIRPPLSSHQ
jgi:hypothetical protein